MKLPKMILMLLGIMLMVPVCKDEAVGPPDPPLPPVRWQALPFNTSLKVTRLLASADGVRLFAGTDRGIFVTADKGLSWAPVNQGLPSLDVLDLARTSDGTTLFAALWDAGVYATTDQGMTWTGPGTGMTNRSVYSVAVSPDDASLFAGTWGGGIYVSTDRGATWVAKNAGLADECVRAVLVCVGGGHTYAGTFRGLSISTDLGVSWSNAAGGIMQTQPRTFAMSSDGRHLFAGTMGCGTYYSSDRGVTWALRSPMNVRSIAVSRTGALVYAGTSGGVYSSTNAGSTWKQINEGLDSLSVTSLVIVPNQYVYAGLTAGGVYRRAVVP